MTKLSQVFILAVSLVALLGCAGSADQNASYEASDHIGDADRDGVTNQYDQCPNTPRTTSVDENGCRLELALDATRDEFLVMFAENSASLSEREKNVLLWNKSAFSADDVSEILVEPFILPRESDGLLNERASAVISSLIELGADPQLIRQVPMGSLSDEHVSGAEHEQAVNRRVYIRVTH